MANQRRLLRSWKEIATFLHCDIKTCRRYEIAAGLPIHRIKNSRKASIFAYENELEFWLKSQKAQNQGPKDRATKGNGLKLGARPVIWGVAIIMISLGLYLGLDKGANSQPSRFRIEPPFLEIYDKGGHAIRKIDTQREDLRSDQFYREHFGYRRRVSDGACLTLLQFRDINKDGTLEILFVPKTENDLGEGILYCYRHDGEYLWEFDTGLLLGYGDRQFSRDYRIRGFELHDLNRDGKLEIVLISCHYSDFPCRLVVLDSAGVKLSEYWNSGHLADLGFVDIDQDGLDEIIAAGGNNEYEKACMIALEPLEMSGQSPQTDSQFRAKGVGPGTEKAYVLFPRSPLDEDEPYPGESAAFVEILREGRIRIQTMLSGIVYELDNALAVISASSSRDFIMKYKQALVNKKSIPPLSGVFWEKQKSRTQIWNGLHWVSMSPPNLLAAPASR